MPKAGERDASIGTAFGLLRKKEGGAARLGLQETLATLKMIWISGGALSMPHV